MSGEKNEPSHPIEGGDDSRIDKDAYDPKNPGESKAGRGGIVSPGGTLHQPEEDPRKDSGLHDEPAHPEQHKD